MDVRGARRERAVIPTKSKTWVFQARVRALRVRHCV